MLPNFLIVGAAKSGTTSVYHYLRQHPEIRMPHKLKESFFLIEPKSILGSGPDSFGKGLVDDLEDYKKLFTNSKNTQANAVGEACVGYLYFFENTIPNIQKYLGDVRIIIILRNPIDRAFSNYLHHLRDNLESLSFEEALKEDELFKRKGWWWGFQLIDVGFYYNQVKAYLDNFNQIKIYLFDDLQNDTLNLVKSIYEFLNVKSAFTPEINISYNVSGIPKNTFVHDIFTKPNPIKTVGKKLLFSMLPEEKRMQMFEYIRMKNLQKPQMKPQTRTYLKQVYRDDILKLQDLIDRDLSHWLSG